MCFDSRRRAAMPAVKIVTELEPVNMYYKAEVGVLVGWLVRV